MVYTSTPKKMGGVQCVANAFEETSLPELFALGLSIGVCKFPRLFFGDGFAVGFAIFCHSVPKCYITPRGMLVETHAGSASSRNTLLILVFARERVQRYPYYYSLRRLGGP